MNVPLLCETVTARTLASLRAARDASRTADMVELRLDGVADVDVAGALEGRARPVVVTCRPRWEGGAFDGSEEERHGLLAQALALGADYVDVEWRADFAEGLVRSTGGARIVLSHHDFTGVPADLVERCRAMRASGAEIVKVAVTADRLSDSLRLLDVTRGGRAVAVGMGPAGVVTRILAARFGSCWTYAGNGIAPGQLPAQELVDVFRFRHLRAETTVYGVVGKPVLQSLSPAMHNAAFAAVGADAVYLPLQAADFEDFLRFSETLRIAGASVTIPYKRDALQAAWRVDEIAWQVGAANTMRRAKGGWEATNTDVAGFLAPLLAPAKADPSNGDLEGPSSAGSRKGQTLRGIRASVLGAGGAARAVIAGLVAEGARVTVHARSPKRADALAAVFGAATGPWPPVPGSWELLVNATPLGGFTQLDESPLPGGPFDGRLVYDLVYAPRETRLLREARAAGCKTIGGLLMLVAQAERQFEWWTGTKAPQGVMARAAIQGHEDHEDV